MSQINVNNIYDGNGTESAKLYGVSMRYGGTNFVNRIINGNMVIDQRNAGASVTAVNGAYNLDRWVASSQNSSVFSVQQSSVVPTGFNNSLLVTSLASTSIGASSFYSIQQIIEGFNVADLGWGTANAQTVTLSFWVRSSLVGAFSGCLQNGNVNRSYPFSYTISAADTWEQKTVTVPGDTTGTWGAGNTAGLYVLFSLGTGSDRIGTVNAWQAGNFRSATGAVNVVATSGATFYITGVQLEAGSVATPFERRPFGTELALCQRYFWRTDGLGFAGPQASGAFIAATVGRVRFNTPVSLRATPTLSVTSGNLRGGGASIGPSSYTVEASTGGATYVTCAVTGASSNNSCELTSDNAITLSAEL